MIYFLAVLMLIGLFGFGYICVVKDWVALAIITSVIIGILTLALLMAIAINTSTQVYWDFDKIKCNKDKIKIEYKSYYKEINQLYYVTTEDDTIPVDDDNIYKSEVASELGLYKITYSQKNWIHNQLARDFIEYILIIKE